MRFPDEAVRMTIEEIISFPYDPRLLLGVPCEAGDREIEAAWKKAGSPTDGILAEAYLMLRDETSRIRTDLLNLRPYSRASDAASALKRHPVYVGPGLWYKTIARNYRL